MDEGDLSSQPSAGDNRVNSDLLLDLEGLLATSGGRNVLIWMLSQAGVYSGLYSGETDLTHVNIGRRDGGLRLIAKLEEISPTAYPLLLLEAARDRANKEVVNVLDDE